MESDPIHGKILMKDGQWLVPEDQRPREYRAVATSVESVQVVRIEGIAVEVASVEEMLADPPEVQCPLPECPPELHRKFFELCMKIYDPDDISCENLDDELEDQWCLAEQTSTAITDYALARKKNMSILGGWITSFRPQLRHLGIRSAPVTAVWEIVQDLTWQNARLERELCFLLEHFSIRADTPYELSLKIERALRLVSEQYAGKLEKLLGKVREKANKEEKS